MRILHIEDQQDAIDEVGEMLADHFTVDACKTLKGACKRLDVTTYDLLLVDLNLTDSYGLNTAAHLMAYDVPIVILTKDPSPETVKGAAEIGVADYICKSDLGRINLPMRLSFVYQKSAKTAAILDPFANLDSCRSYVSVSSLFAPTLARR